jgi:valyl-tRNA synthetase
MTRELPKQYDPASVEEEIYSRWLSRKAFAAAPDEREDRYVIMMPLPNVTGALHMGHAMDNVMQDLLTRWHRMRGDNTLWMAGTDHAGIATQAVVEKRLLELEGKTRHDIGREKLIERIWEWKDQYQKRIVSQQQSMGCSCDWDRQRFTMDPVCERAVRRTFFNMFRDGLIYRGNRLVNWDCHLQTAVSDDEIYHEKVDGHFWHIRYPVIDPLPGEPEFVTVATTRPETMLGDTAVACHPDPAGCIDEQVGRIRESLEGAAEKDREAIAEQLAGLEARRESHLPTLEKLKEMAASGRMLMLPLLERPIPLICDEWAKPELGSGCVKITPAHDPNDYEVWTRHKEEIDIINILEIDGSLAKSAGSYAKLDRYEARERVVADLDKLGLLEAVEDREVEVGHSDRSKTPAEPFISRQWFVRMGDLPDGVTCGRGTEREFNTPGLAQAAIDAVEGEWKSASGRKLEFHPDPVRYGNTYINWLAEKRDWCISRQLWWGHRIPIWSAEVELTELSARVDQFGELLDKDDVCLRVGTADGSSRRLTPGCDMDAISGELDDQALELMVCLLGDDADAGLEERLGDLGFERDPDVLDTWFSSGIWPHSTLGWPDPATARVGEGQSQLGAVDGNEDCLEYYYPGSCLVTGRDIITLWVARMALMGLYNIGDLPFTDVFIHATILDGKGERMSKSKGNGIDPVDIIERYGADAMRYVVCELQTGMQDIRLPVQAISPFTGNMVDLAEADHGGSIFTYICPESGKEFDVLGTMEDLPAAKLVSDRFEVGRNFCNKLLNATRFALMNLEGVGFEPRELQELAVEDRWLLSRLALAIEAVDEQLESYSPAAAISLAREFFWSELCDWYLEFIKPRVREAGKAQLAGQVLAVALDQVLRLLHPFVPFITEFLWERLGEQAPRRGLGEELGVPELLVHAPWPQAAAGWRDEELEKRFELLQEIIRAIRDIRSKNEIPLADKLPVRIRADAERSEQLEPLSDLLVHMGVLESLEISAEAERTADSAVAVVRDIDIYIPGAVDLEKEKARLAKQRDQLGGRIEGAKKKLSNENFVNKASPEVVERERERLGELEAELAKVEANLASLD